MDTEIINLNLQAVSSALGIKTTTLRKYIRKRLIPFTIQENKPVISLKDCKAWVMKYGYPAKERSLFERENKDIRK